MRMWLIDTGYLFKSCSGASSEGDREEVSVDATSRPSLEADSEELTWTDLQRDAARLWACQPSDEEPDMARSRETDVSL